MDLIKEISIVVPCYNESKNLKLLLNRCKNILKTKNIEIEIVIVNNGSNDCTKELLDSLKLSKNFKIVHLDVNYGYGNGIMEGLKNSSHKYLAWTHADLQTDIFDVIRGIKYYNKNSIFVKGRRIKREFFSKILSLGMTLYCFLVLRVWVNEINAQPKIFSKIFFDEIRDNAPSDFSLDLYFCINALRFGKIEEFPVIFEQRQFGEAKGGGGNFKQKMNVINRTIKFINEFKL